MLNERLKACTEYVSGKGTACDVGTDHAYLACELIKNGKCSHVIASDINVKPLEFAENTVNKYNLSDKVDLILSDGLERISGENISDVIIAGMGGETIADIIDNCEWIKNNVNLILQPMTKAPYLRTWLYKYGYKIKSEKAVRDGSFIYTVINAVYCGDSVKLSEFSSIVGHLDFSLDISKKYLDVQINKLEKISDGLIKSGKISEGSEKKELLMRMKFLSGFDSLCGKDIYNILDEIYPFSTQEKWDNSGYLAGDKSEVVNKILLSLDITKESVCEGMRNRADMIISHHPVIFNPLKSVTSDSVVYRLVKNNISAICMHTNLDIAEDGTNGVIAKKLSEKLEISSFEPLDEIGGICNLVKPVSSEKLAEILKGIFGCKVIKYCCENSEILRIAFCSGSGGSMLDEVIEKECDAFITGDIKHDVWISANDKYLILFDCGHFHTENIVLEHLKNVLDANFPFIETKIAESSADPVKYLI